MHTERDSELESRRTGYCRGQGTAQKQNAWGFVKAAIERHQVPVCADPGC